MVLLDIAVVSELLRVQRGARQWVRVEGGIRDHGQDVAGRRLDHHDCAVLVGARRQRRQGLPCGVLQRGLDGEVHVVGRHRLLFAEEELTQRLGWLLVGPQEGVVLLLNAGRPVIERRVVPGDPGVERTLGVLPHVAVRVAGFVRAGRRRRGGGQDSAVGGVDRASRIDVVLRCDAGIEGRRLQRLGLDQLDVHQLRHHEAETDDHDDAEPSDPTAHQPTNRFVDDPITGSMVGGGSPAIASSPSQRSRHPHATWERTGPVPGLAAQRRCDPGRRFKAWSQGADC